MKKPKRIATGFIIVAGIYFSAYIVCRLQGVLIHRQTWGGGWNRHWVEPAFSNPSVQSLPFAPSHIPGDQDYNATMDQFKREFLINSRRRQALGIIYFPLRLLESAGWWVLHPAQ